MTWENRFEEAADAIFSLEEFRDGDDGGDSGDGRPPLNPQRPVEVGLHGGNFGLDRANFRPEVGLRGE